MTSYELLSSVYAWLHAHSLTVLLGFIALPVVGTVLARIGKGGRTDADGKLIASTVIGLAVTLVFVEIGLLMATSSLTHRPILKVAANTDIVLVIGPPLCLAASIYGMSTVFPLGQLATIRTLREVGLLAAFGYGLIWAIGKFWGWGMVFHGGIGEFLMLAGAAVAVLIYLYKRAFRT